MCIRDRLALLSATLLAACALQRRGDQRDRLELLERINDCHECEDECPRDWSAGAHLIASLDDRLGRAGFIDLDARRRVRNYALACGALSAGLVSSAAFCIWGIFAAAGAALATAHAGACAFVVFLRVRERSYEREVYLQTPLFLESVILLVESGLGVLPALERAVSCRDGGAAVSRLFRIVYLLSSRGMPFTQALETVAEHMPHRILRHVMLHLDLSGMEGGSIIPSLRSLSDYAHSEWRLSVEQRVKRLENFVVFPVFASVMGLMMLIAAVPLVPLLDLKDLLDRSQMARSLEAPAPAEVDGEKSL